MKIATKKTWTRKMSSEVSWNQIKDNGEEIEMLTMNQRQKMR
jgi:hypothetical protein